MNVVPMSVELIDYMGSDVSVANAARVSFAKTSMLNEDGSLREGDAKLIKFLARENHWSPFAHCFISLRIKAPIFVLRQLGKHQVGLSWNEVSRRYVDFEPEFYLPEVWRGKAANVKQGSTAEEFCHPLKGFVGSKEFNEQIKRLHANTIEAYNRMIENGMCAEQARMVLPQNMMSEFIWSGSLMAFARVCNLRLDSHTQKETRDVAQMMNDCIAPLFPESWAALMKPEPAQAAEPEVKKVKPKRTPAELAATVRLPQETKDAIASMRKLGFTGSKISKVLSLSNGTVYRVLGGLAA